MKQAYILLFAAMLMAACGNGKKNLTTEEVAVGPQFSADSAFMFCQK